MAASSGRRDGESSDRLVDDRPRGCEFLRFDSEMYPPLDQRDDLGLDVDSSNRRHIAAMAADVTRPALQHAWLGATRESMPTPAAFDDAAEQMAGLAVIDPTTAFEFDAHRMPHRCSEQWLPGPFGDDFAEVGAVAADVGIQQRAQQKIRIPGLAFRSRDAPVREVGAEGP